MKIVFLTAGTGSYHCGACMRDNTLVKALHRDGHEVALLPMYLPMMLDEDVLPEVNHTPVFFGGINVYLQQKFSFFRKTPRWLDRLLNGSGLLKAAAKRSHMTSAREHGEMALAMLRVEESQLTKELDKLTEWLRDHEKPDLICLSNALLAGLTRELKRRLDNIPMIAFFQGEDTFLDGLPEPYRTECWEEMKVRLEECDRMVAPTKFYGDMMAARMGLNPAAIDVLPNGIDLSGYSPSKPNEREAPVIGYLARMCEVKGLGILVDAFLALHRVGGPKDCRLRVVGSCTDGDEEFVAELKQRLAAAGLTELVDWHPNVTREEKARLLRSFTLFSVPVTYPEAFGLYVVEAMACGVPVVQPKAASFPEIVETTGAGELVAPEDAEALAAAWKRLLSEPETRREMGERGRRGAEHRFSVGAMKNGFVALARRVVGKGTPAQSIRS